MATTTGASHYGEITMSANYDKLNKEATRALYNLLKNNPKVELVEFDDGIEFQYRGHVFRFTSEVVE